MGTFTDGTTTTAYVSDPAGQLVGTVDTAGNGTSYSYDPNGNRIGAGYVVGPDNDIAAQIESCVQDARAFYTLSFDPPKADRANEYHDLKVTVDQPGLTARSSTGYYNQP